MRLVTYYTDTHAEMCKRYVLSRAWKFDDVQATHCQQRCPTGAFKSDGWNACMLDKLECLLRLPQDGQATLYVDSDVVLMPGLSEWCEQAIRDADFDEIQYSDDVVQWCAGVMLFRSTARVHAWWRMIADLSPVWKLPDQDVIHQLRMQSEQMRGTLPVPMSEISGDVVSNWATIGNRSVWNGEAFTVPPTCLAWHANWCVGVEAKAEMLRRVAAGETSDGVVRQG
jgi:hypothetical protein